MSGRRPSVYERSVDTAASTRSRFDVARARAVWGELVRPDTDGLPNAEVVGVPLVLLAAIFLGLVASGITGSSTGFVHSLVSTHEDANLLLGNPQGMRSDEWFVQTSWTISQVQQDLPVRNETFPGGMDATVQHDLPTRDWSSAFRPHLIAFHFLPLDQAMAVKWWLPGFVLIGAAYLFAVSMLPRRPVSAFGLALAFYFSPFFQWWYLSSTLYAPAWALLVMATVVWCLRSRRRAGPWILAVVLAYTTVALGMGIYVPFIVPVALVAFAFGAGAVLTRDKEGTPLGRRFARIMPVLVAGFAGVAVLVVWLVTRWDTIVGFTSTVYPGERLQSVGHANWSDFGGLFSGPVSVALLRSGGKPFAINSSEASTFLLPGLFLIVVVVWLVVDRRRAGRGMDAISIGLLLAGGVMLAYLFAAGWDAVAHALLLDRTTYGRMRVGFGVLSVAVVVVIAARLVERRDDGLPRPPWWPAAVGAVLAAVVTVPVVWAIVNHFGLELLIEMLPMVALVAGAALVLSFILIVWLYGVGSFGWATAVLLIVSVISSAWVNPWYRGVLDLRETEIAAEMRRVQDDRPGEWVGVATTPLPTMLLVETGFPSFNGFQSSPAERMWNQIDPESTHDAVWNRLANVSWVAGAGEPAPRNPAPDQIQLTFDSCAEFAQTNVDWVLSDHALDQACLTPQETVVQGPTTMHIYAVTPESGR